MIFQSILQQEDLVKALKKELEKAKNAIARTTAELNKLDVSFDQISDELQGQYADENEISKWIERASKEAVSALLNLSATTYKAVSRIAMAIKNTSPSYAFENENAVLTSAEEDAFHIQCFIENGVIFAACPILCSSNLTREVSSRDGNRFQTANAPMFGESLWRAFLHNENYKTLDLDSFREKTCYLLFAYNSTNHVPDNDNHDIKSTIDGITKELPGGDSATSCRIILDGIITEHIPEATYICIIPGKKSNPSCDKIVQFWAEKQPKN